MDRNLSLIKPIMESTYGKESAVKWTVYWRTFFIAVAELFGYDNGEEWMVAHFLFKKKSKPKGPQISITTNNNREGLIDHPFRLEL